MSKFPTIIWISSKKKKILDSSMNLPLEDCKHALELFDWKIRMFGRK